MTRRHHRVLSGVVATAVACALVMPSAMAAPAEQIIPRTANNSDTGPNVAPPPSLIARSAAEEYAQLRDPGDANASPVRVVTASADTGFDWGDASIGATGALALMTVGAGVALALGRWPRRRQPV